MAEDTTTADEGTETGPEQAGDDWETSTGKGGKQAVLAELAETRREARAAKAELRKLREASQTEQEKALAEAEQRGATAVLSKVGARLAKAELRAAAAGTVDKDTLDGFLEYADLSRFLGEDGEPDDKAIAAAVKRLGGGSRQTDFDGGPRSSAAKPTDMNSLIRHQAGLG